MQDNAASRLLKFVQRARAIDPNTISIRAWEQLLGVRKDQAVFLSRLGKLMALPEEIAEALSTSVGSSPQVTQHIAHQFYTAFTSHKFNEKWEGFLSRIDVHMANYLEMASTLLETQCKTEELSPESIDQMRVSFSQLLERVLAAELAPRLKVFVIRQLRDLIAALDDYSIAGADPVLRRIEATIGHAAFDSEYRTFLQDNELGKSVLECLGAAANLVTVAVGIPQLAHLIHLLQSS